MLEIIRFYMPDRWALPMFGTNSAAANMWLMLVLSAGTMLGSVASAVLRSSIEGVAVLGSASAVCFALARVLLPKARRLQQVDQIIRRSGAKPH